MKTQTLITSDIQQMLVVAHERSDQQYAMGLRLRARADRLIAETIEMIRGVVPTATFSLIEKGPASYLLDVEVDSEEEEDCVDAELGARTTGLLVNHQIWLVIIVTLRKTYD